MLYLALFLHGFMRNVVFFGHFTSLWPFLLLLFDCISTPSNFGFWIFYWVL